MNFVCTCYIVLLAAFTLGCSDSGPDTPEKPIPENPTEPTEPTEPTVFDEIMERIQKEHRSVSPSTVEAETTKWLAGLKTDGSFSDIDYTRRDQTNWTPIAHLDRLKLMVLAYTMPGNRYSNDASLLDKIAKALQYWYDKHPTSTNWYMQQIACPQRMGVLLILLRAGKEQLPKALENKLIDRMKTEGGRPDQSGSQGTGANKLDIATHWVYRGCLNANTTTLTFGADQVYYPLFLTTQEGLQHDFSYQQHGNQLYIGGYGFVLISGIGNVAKYLTGTNFALPAEKADLLSKFARTSYFPVIRGEYFLYNTVGRSLARKNALFRGGSSNAAALMKQLDAANANEYEASVQRMTGQQPAGYNIQPKNTHFWRSDYTLHQRPGFAFDTRTASIYTARNENGNGENLLGYFLTDGANAITVQGDEYVDIFPVWDWAMIPGITAPHLSSIPKPAEWEIKGKCQFTGGASDGRYGVSTYKLNDTDYGINTKALKSWFYFDDEVVCLGADVQSSSSQPIYTTVNQCLLDGTVSIHHQGGTQTAVSGKQAYTDPSWVWHNEVGYFFPKGGNISVSNQAQTGDWKTINSSLASETVSKNVFKLWFDHGTAPQKQTYAYIVAPGLKTASAAGSYAVNNIQILANTDSVQVVRNERLNVYGMIFARAATFEAGSVKVHANKGCALLLKNVGTSQVNVFIADPSRKESEVKLTVTLPGISGQKVSQCTLPTHPDPLAGSTKEFVIR